jgi:mannose-6-phosphate isomerase-like protein (cupin superfamily)
MTKIELIENTEKWLASQKFSISSKDTDRPWGAFWHVAPESTDAFLKQFFPNFEKNGQFISPKFLLVEPQKRLSLQFHHRRAEEWHVVQGPVKVIADNQELILKPGESITLQNGETHRLCGLETTGLVAEIWKHTDPNNQSNENDIVRLEDDFSRN